MFSGRQYRGGPPPVCWRGPPIGPPLPPGRPALTLHAFARWTDLDPDAPADQAAIFELPHVGPGNIYFGSSTPAGDRLDIRVTQIGSTTRWAIELIIWDATRLPETFSWIGVHVDPDEHFTTPFLTDLVLPNLDFRLCQVAE